MYHFSLTLHEISLEKKVCVCVYVHVCKFFFFIVIPQTPNSDILLGSFKKYALGYKALF